MKWQPSVNSAGFRGPLPEAEYVSLATAQALVAAFMSDDWDSTSELERLAGVENFSNAAERAFMIHGLPQLDPVAVARRLAEVSMRPSRKAPAPDTPEAPAAPAPHDSYGFTPRR